MLILLNVRIKKLSVGSLSPSFWDCHQQSNCLKSALVTTPMHSMLVEFEKVVLLMLPMNQIIEDNEDL